MSQSSDSTASVRLEQHNPAADKPTIDPSQFWSKDSMKLTLDNTRSMSRGAEGTLTLTSPYDGINLGGNLGGKSEPIDGRYERHQVNVPSEQDTYPAKHDAIARLILNPPKDELVNPRDIFNPANNDGIIYPLNPPKFGDRDTDIPNPLKFGDRDMDILNPPKDGDGTRDIYTPPKDRFDPRDILNPPKETDPQKERDQRDADAMMDAMRSGKLDDVKKLVADMSPEKLKRVAEQMKAEGFDMTTKDGKLVMFNKELGLGVSVGPNGEAEVVKKDENGNFVKSQDGVKPEALLKDFSKNLQLQEDDIVKKITEAMKDHNRSRRHYPYDDGMRFFDTTETKDIYKLDSV